MHTFCALKQIYLNIYLVSSNLVVIFRSYHLFWICMYIEIMWILIYHLQRVIFSYKKKNKPNTMRKVWISTKIPIFLCKHFFILRANLWHAKPLIVNRTYPKNLEVQINKCYSCFYYDMWVMNIIQAIHLDGKWPVMRGGLEHYTLKGV